MENEVMYETELNETTEVATEATSDFTETGSTEDTRSFEIKLTLTQKIIEALKTIWRFICIPFKFIAGLFNRNKSTDSSEE